MKNCDDILIEYGVDFLENEAIPEEISEHFKNCSFCIKELEKQKNILSILKEKLVIEEKIPEIDLPPVLRKKEKYKFFALSLFFFLFFLIIHSVLNVAFLKPYILIFSNLGLTSAIQLNLKVILFILILISLTFTIFYQIRKFLKKL